MSERKQQQQTIQRGLKDMAMMLDRTAPLVAAYSCKLVAGGISKQVAAVLTRDMQQALLNLLMKPTA